ncbi:MAG: flagellin [Mixta calida]|jgi:flagellin|uniref:Flagellin n=2 Tax=Mixta calida TaxID=665913 RepID=A0ABM6S4S9_9GAMM|nr:MULTISPECIES: flagellin [Mixta]AIX72386.1 flagellin [Pantoea sp. PSNIH2]MBS6057433.1 flagellin [Pantoea sp.]POU47466.1 flagellin [Pantoea sp. PSNIH5]POU66080.1 flagellin [Pantoea sp. PSNIH4]POY68060.1 flagellin [Pantoea sp. PSNIH3]HCW47167.1 flagellin [Erwiniaceae bacterium]
MATIYTNLLSANVLKNQAKDAPSLSQTIARLSSGLRINSAKDDAAGQAISNRMTANIGADTVIARGLDDGISLSETADGGLDTISNLLIRGKELAIRSVNDALSDSDRQSLQDEFQQISETIDQIAGTTEIFGKYPLASAVPELPVKLGNVSPATSKFPVPGNNYGFSSGVVSMAYIPAGATNVVMRIDSYSYDDDIQIFTRDGKHLVGTPLQGSDPDSTWVSKGITSAAQANSSVLTEANGFLPGASYDDSQLVQGGSTYDVNGSATQNYNGMSITYSGDGDRYEDASTGGFNDGSVASANTQERVTINNVTEDLVVIVVGNGSFGARMTWGNMPTPTYTPDDAKASSPMQVVTSANFGDTLQVKTIEPTPSDSASLGLAASRLNPKEEAEKALGALDKALQTVSGYRGEYGSTINSLESTKASLSQQTVATTAARSRIMDADYALEASNLTKQQILQQASNAVLVQANQQPQLMLSLLKG